MISLRSKITKEVLGYFFLNPDSAHYVNELERLFKVDKRNLVKKLKELEEEGLMKSAPRGNLKLYSINRKFPLFGEYKNIVLKTVGLESKLKLAIRGVKGVRSAIIYGSYAKDKMGAHSDIDLLVIGSHSSIDLQRYIGKIQRETGREINVVNMGGSEYKERLKKKDPFLNGITKNKHINIV
jgi:predicted nucleotidyltransferase